MQKSSVEVFVGSEMEHMKALVPFAVGFASTHFPDPHGHAMDAHARPWRAETSNEVVVLSVPSIHCGTRTPMAGTVIGAGDPTPWAGE